MMIDQELVFAENQSFAANASTAWKDLGKGIEPFSLKGSGQELALVATVKTDFTTGGVASETYQFLLEMADDNTGTNATIAAATDVISGANLEAGQMVVASIKPLAAYKRWYRFRTVVAGTAPSGTAAVRLDYLDRVQHHPATPSEVGN